MTFFFRSVVAATLAATLIFAPHHADAQTRVRLAVGGQAALYYLPLTLTAQLGYFKDEGLDLEITDLSGGSRSLQALVSGSVDVVAGAYDHTIQMQAKNQPIVAVVQLGRYPGFALGIAAAKASAYRGPADLRGMKIGVTAPGSSTHFMAQHMMVQSGVKADDASFIGVGSGAAAIAAVRRGTIDALVNVDPVIALLENEQAIKIVADARTPDGTRQIYGGIYPAAVLYTTPAYAQTNPQAMQSLVNALVRGLKWLSTHSPEDIARAMPPEYALGNFENFVRSIRSSQPMYSPDGRFSREGADTALAVLREFDPTVRSATIDLTKTYTNAFLDRVPAR